MLNPPTFLILGNPKKNKKGWENKKKHLIYNKKKLISIIALMMEAVSTSETSVISTRPHDETAQKILNIKNIATYKITAQI
jgi:hypothetical protein